MWGRLAGREQLVAVCHELLRNAPFAVQLVAVCHELLRAGAE